MHAIYCRVSSEDQARSGYSLDDQRQACRNRLLSMELTDIAEYIDDGYSGEYIERPHLDRLRNDLRSGMIQTVVIYDPDRMSRNLTVQLILADEIEKAGAQLYFVTGDYDASPEGRLFFSMKGAIAAYEKEKIRERTSRGRRAKAAKGKIVLNTHPFGYSWDGANSMYIIDEKEAETVRLIYHLCLNEGLGAGSIATELIRMGLPGRNNKPLTPCTIHRILSKEMYYGQHFLFKQRVKKTGQKTREVKNNPPELWIPIQIPAIVSQEMWIQVQQQRQKNKKLAKRNTKSDYLLRGLLHCALCNRSMIAYARPGWRKTMPEKVYYYYSCVSKESNSYGSKERCHCRRIPVKALEEAVWQTLVQIAAAEKLFADYLCHKDTPDYTADIASLINRQNELKRQQTALTHWYRQNLIDSETAEKELRNVNKELSATLAALSGLTIAQAKIKQPAILPADLLKAKSFAEKRNILLNFPYEIHTVRVGDNFEFWFKEQSLPFV
ncbi:site-specific recombinases active site [Lucifera butyrica]|uniref:Site-specific recombinases active site n=1 Tax=Lucifera butyrica TaxID=1351585 RepID=A0A498R5U3_9FIRM|nr:recombinase family protein [Lucifera butyrica]VBB06207.1 site-specific recombinases active site [Lucifera butyrica]